jgi:hypothetical protein
MSSPVVMPRVKANAAQPSGVMPRASKARLNGPQPNGEMLPLVSRAAWPGRLAWLMEFSRELRDDVLAGDITVSFRLWRRPKVRVGGRYPVGPGYIEVDAVELMPFSSITPADLRRSGEKDMESLRHRAAHAGPVTGDTLLYRVEFHAVAAQ